MGASFAYALPVAAAAVRGVMSQNVNEPALIRDPGSRATHFALAPLDRITHKGVTRCVGASWRTS